jgi:hypothetical protein
MHIVMEHSKHKKRTNNFLFDFKHIVPQLIFKYPP